VRLNCLDVVWCLLLFWHIPELSCTFFVRFKRFMTSRSTYGCKIFLIFAPGT
jgi:hypothetical protein